MQDRQPALPGPYPELLPLPAPRDPDPGPGHGRRTGTVPDTDADTDTAPVSAPVGGPGTTLPGLSPSNAGRAARTVGAPGGLGMAQVEGVALWRSRGIPRDTVTIEVASPQGHVA